MANIMITEACNLQCPYCFANEFVNKQSNYISMEAFKTALDFIKSAADFDGRIGIIGGEPTVAPNFEEIMSLLINDISITSIAVYTNGVLVDKYLSFLTNPKIDFLINLNSPEDIGEINYKRILDNIWALIKNGKISRIALGINLYKEDQDVEYYIDALRQFGIRHARVAITTPNDCIVELGFNRLKRLRKELLKLTTRLMYENILFTVDCNRPPECIWNEEEQIKLEFIHKRKLNRKQYDNFFISKCNPVIDILPDLTAIRCFGLSGISKVNISDYKNIDDLMKYYREVFDSEILTKPSSEECLTCKAFKSKTCYGGCLSNKRCY